MLRVFLHVILMATVVFIFANAFPVGGVHVNSYVTAILVAIVLGILNVTLKPILRILTFPITILTLGFFSLVVNAAILMLVPLVVSGFSIDSFWSAVVFGMILSFLNWMFSALEHGGHHHNEDERE